MRSSYLARRDGRYVLQIRVKNRARPFLGRSMIRYALSTGDSSCARRRVARIMEWMVDIVEAPDLEAVAARIETQLVRCACAPTTLDEDDLAARLVLERFTRDFLARADERGWSVERELPRFLFLWHAFVGENERREAQIAARARRRVYEQGRADARADAHREADAKSVPIEPVVTRATSSDRAGRRLPAPVEFETARARAAADPAGAQAAITMMRHRTFSAVDLSTKPLDGEVAPEPTGDDIPDLRVIDADDAPVVASDEAAARASNVMEAAPHMLVVAPAAPLGVRDADAGAPRGLSSTILLTPAAPILADADDDGVCDDDDEDTIDHAALAAEPIAPRSKKIRLSTALKEFLEQDQSDSRKSAARLDQATTIRFMIDLLGDLRLDQITRGDIARLDEALSNIPYPKGFPGCRKASLYERYMYAQQNGWSGLQRAGVETVINRYRTALRVFFVFLKKRNFYHGDLPTFTKLDDRLLCAMPRDALQDDELISLVSLPLFTGARSTAHMWKPGRVLHQSDLYWALLILILTGMRPGEVGQIKLDQIRSDGEFFYIDLRPFDPSRGRVPIGELAQYKTKSSARVVPIHPLLVDLGLIERAQLLLERGETRLFPDWDPYRRRDGDVRWSQKITKCWVYLERAGLVTKRPDMSLYSTRHLMAAWLDTSGISERTRKRILGHTLSEARLHYGRKGALDPAEARIIAAIEPPVVAQMRTILMGALERARCGELELVEI